MYRDPIGQPYCRTEYIRSVPHSRITRDNIGKLRPNYNLRLSAHVDRDVQIRDSCLEACRVTLNRHLVRDVGKDAFFARFRKMPYQILRENKMATGAGADRLSSGMRHAFGKTVGRACRYRKGEKLLDVLIEHKHSDATYRVLKGLASKLSCGITIQIEPKVTIDENHEAVV